MVFMFVLLWFPLVHIQCTPWNLLDLFLFDILLFTDKKNDGNDGDVAN